MPHSDSSIRRRKFLSIAISTVTVSGCIHDKVGDGETSQGNSRNDTEVGGRNGSSTTDGRTEDTSNQGRGTSVEIQVSDDVATIRVVEPGRSNRITVEWFGVSPEEAETAVEDGYRGEKVEEMKSAEDEAMRLSDLASGTYVVVAVAQDSRREAVGSFEIT